MTVVTEAPATSQNANAFPGPTTASPRKAHLIRALVASIVRRVATEGGIAVILCIALYFTIAMILDFKTLSFFGDAFSRMANGFYVLYSRNPHLAAVGFVWNPLQSICDIVPLLFWHLWPALASHDVAGSVVSTLCMAGAVYQLNRSLREWGVSRTPRLVVTAIFALNPMVLLYGANGMSEPLYLFSLVATTRYLARWLRNDDLRSLIYAATTLGLCYLVRNEALAAAGCAGVLVLGVSYRRDTGDRRTRIMRALTDCTICVMPVATCLVGWAAASYVITGQPFAQFTSQYGTSAQIAAGAGDASKFALGSEMQLELHALEYLAPLLPIIAIAALIRAWRRRDPLVLVPLSVVVAALAFDLAAYLSGSIIWSFRYFIATLPAEMLLVGVILAPSPQRQVRANSHVGQNSSAWEGRQAQVQWLARVPRRWLASLAGAVVALVLLAPSIPATAAGMFNPIVGSLELQSIGYVFHHRLTKSDRVDQQHYDSILKIANYIDHMNLPGGDVIADDSSLCVPETIVNVTNPKVFVIPNDRDFQPLLADPLTFHVHYILVPQPIGDNVNTATVKAYPTLYASGAGFTKEVHQFPSAGLCPAFRLYRVIAHPDQVGGTADTASATNQ